MSDIREVVILMGGASSEREVSLVSGRAVMEAIDTNRFHARSVDLGAVGRLQHIKSLSAVDTDAAVALAGPGASVDYEGGAHRLARELRIDGRLPDIVFIALHGRYGEDGCIQGMLELLGVPYTGSGVLASALAMDKITTKRILSSAGVPTPRWISATADFDQNAVIQQTEQICGFPCIIKPNREGSTIGATIVRDPSEVPTALEKALRHDKVALIEEFVTGTEITVGVLGNQVLQTLPVVEIRPRGGFYDYEAKYTAGLTEKIVPADIPEDVAEEACRLSELTHRTLGCSGMSRVDFIVASSGLQLLEVNTIPGLTPTSLLPRAAQAAGMTFTDLISRIIEYGLEEGVR